MEVLSSWHDHISFNHTFVEDVILQAVMADPPIPGPSKGEVDSPGSSSSDASKIPEAGPSSSSSTSAGKVQKRVRTSKPKVKTGCSMCKYGHVLAGLWNIQNERWLTFCLIQTEKDKM